MTDAENQALVPIDLIQREGPFDAPPAPQPQAPTIPPPPLQMPRLTPEIRRSVGAGQPVTQELRHTVYSGMPGGGNGSPLDAPGVPRRAMPCVQFLAQLANSAEGLEYQVEIHRTGPAVWEGQRIPFGVIERFPASQYSELYEQIKQLHGGGAYKLRVLNAEGAQVHQMPFTIPTITDPPMVRPVGSISQVPRANLLGLGGDGSAQDDIMVLRTTEQKLRAQKSTVLAEADLDQTRRDLEKRRRLESDLEEKKAQMPLLHKEAAESEMRREMREQQQQSERRFEQMMQNFQNMIVTLAKPPTDNSQSLILVEMIRAQSAQAAAQAQAQASMMTAMMAGGNGKASEMIEAAKLNSASQQSMFQLMLTNATTQAGKSERLLEQVLVHRLEHPDQAVKQAIEMRNAGFDQARQMFELVEDIRGDRGGGEAEINPEGGFMGNLGNLILVGLKNLVAGAAKGGGAQALAALAAGLQKPPGTTQFTDQELAMAAQNMERAALQGRQQPQLPGPAQQPQQQAPQQPGQQRPRGRIFEGVYETEDVPLPPPAQPTPQPQQTIFTPPPVFAPQTSVEVPVPQVHAPVLEEVEEDDSEDTPEERLAEFVTEAMVTALTDITDGRKEHEWVDFAIGKWPREFKHQIANAPDDATRVAMIQQYTDPVLFEKLKAKLMDQAKPQDYTNFVENLHEFCEEVQKELVGVGV